MPRADLSNYLVHWVKGDSHESAFAVLSNIVSEQLLRGSNGLIKGGYQCVCFTEAPKNTFHQVIGKYRPFGIQVPKRWLYEQGGRPVIYQSDAEFEALSDSHRWRHMRYELSAERSIDFTWEREWRIQVQELPIPPQFARILVPAEAWAEKLRAQHDAAEQSRIEMEAMAYGQEWLAQEPGHFSYAYSVINV